MSSAFLNSVSLYYVKCDPKRPSSKMDPKNPQWEVQIRTTDPEVNNQWVEMGLPAKFVIPKGKTPADGYFRCNLSKRAFKKDGEPAQAVEVVTGDLRPLDPNTIGNGSIGNLRLLSRKYEHNNQTKTAWYLMGIQITNMKPYEGGTQGFAATGYTVEQEEGEEQADEEAANGFTKAPVTYQPPAAPAQANPTRSPGQF